MVKKQFAEYETLFDGDLEKSASALGYTVRRYHDFRTGRADAPKAVVLAMERLIQQHNQLKDVA